MLQVDQVREITKDTGDNSLIDVRELTVRFGGRGGLFLGKDDDKSVVAVNDVSLRIRESEIISLVGESGSGKTTVARCIMGLQRPTGGSIYFEGKTSQGFLIRSSKIIGERCN